jgi:hypothetical protein
MQFQVGDSTDDDQEQNDQQNDSHPDHLLADEESMAAGKEP